MALIHFYQPDGDQWSCREIKHDGSCPDWILKNIKQGVNFAVYDGSDINQANEISRDYEKVSGCEFASIFILPSGGAVGLTLLASLVISAAVALLTPKPKALGNVNRQQESPNNALGDRANKARPNQRIVDICGKVKSIPDVIQQEFARYENNIERKIGYYCIARNQVAVADIKDGDTLIADITDSSAGVYYPFKSPNNSAPDIQIGDPINEDVVGVYQSTDAIGQTMGAENENRVEVEQGTTIDSTGYLEDLSGDSDWEARFKVGDDVDIIDVWALEDPTGGAGGTPLFAKIGENTHTVTAVTSTRITFDRTLDPSWDLIFNGQQSTVDRGGSPSVQNNKPISIGPFKMSSVKVDRLLFNIYSPNGIYYEDNSGRSRRTVDYRVYYQKLDDNLNPVGPETPVDGSISGSNANEKGVTTEVDLGAPTFVEWRVERLTEKDYDFNGNVVDDIKIKDVFGLYSIDQDHFGNVTTIQTSRKSAATATAIRDPEVNCIATELVYLYLGNGIFDTNLTENTQAMQSLIRLALDENIGRRTESELDLETILQTQADIESYFQDPSAGQFSYSFDSSDTTAQETFFTIADAAFTILWREGRVLTSWFERPQSAPKMVFTHRSKKPNAETWNQTFSSDKDSIELKYTNDTTYTQETVYVPADRSGTNPDRIEIPGIKGADQATWRATREFNKLKYRKVDVDFTSTQEGRLVNPGELISVVKGTRVGSYDGYVRSVNGLTLELSQDVTFTAGDDHEIVLKRRDGTVESIPVTAGSAPRFVVLAFAPTEPVYTGNDQLKTEFSFGNEARLLGQLVLPQEINPSKKQYVTIKAINYSPDYYKGDPIQPPTSAFDDGFDDGFE